MAGLETPDGRTFKPDGRGIITLPEELDGYGREAARVCPLFHRYRRQYTGFDAEALEQRYAAWARRGTSPPPLSSPHPFIHTEERGNAAGGIDAGLVRDERAKARGR